MEFSRCAQAGGPPYREHRTTVVDDGTAVKRHWHGLSKLNSVRNTYIEVDVISRRTESSDEDLENEIDINKLGAYRDNCPGIPRKEVIQPQLPLRLPCYDFTPIINPTFDGCLPKGLAHRLRVLPTFVV